MTEWLVEDEKDILCHLEDEFMTEQQELQPGTPIYWRRECRGGWGYVENVIAVTIKFGRRRVGIAVLKADRVTWVPKWVSPDNIRVREV